MNSKDKRRNVVGVTIILVLAFAGLIMINADPAGADRLVGDNAQAAATAESPEFVGAALPSLMRMISALVIVIACIYGGIWLLRKGMNRTGGTVGRTLEVLETTGVAPKKTVSLIRVADKAVLIGVTESGISLLTELTPEETAEIVQAQQPTASESGFGTLLATASGKLREIGLRRKQTAVEA